MTRHQMRMKMLRAGYSIPLERRYKITNVGEYSKTLLRLGAIKEVK